MSSTRTNQPYDPGRYCVSGASQARWAHVVSACEDVDVDETEHGVAPTVVLDPVQRKLAAMVRSGDGLEVDVHSRRN